MTASERKFNALRAKWLAAERCAIDGRNVLRAQYQAPCYARKGERDRLERYEQAERKAGARFVAHLAAISPRSWDRGVPVAYLRMGLSYADAVTAGDLCVVPPPAYSYTDQDMRQFARALPQTAKGQTV